MIHLKTPEQIDSMRRGGALLSVILGELAAMVQPGMTTAELDAHAEARMREEGGEPSFKGYRMDRSTPAFPCTVCTSLNEEVVHGLAVPSRTLQDGDIIGLDIGFRYEGLCTDMAVTVPVGDVDDERMRLVRVTREALISGMEKVRAGGWVADVGKVVDRIVTRAGYTTVKDLVGHGVGIHVHEDPRIPNYFDRAAAPVQFVPGMAVAIEPMVNLGDEDVEVKDDNWTVVTADGSPSAHWEVTLAITEEGTEVLTPIPDVPGV